MKLIDADKLKEAITKKVAYFPFEYKDLLYKIIDELSDEIKSIPTLEAINKTSGKDYTEGGLVNNPLKVAIKEDKPTGLIPDLEKRIEVIEQKLKDLSK